MTALVLSLSAIITVSATIPYFLGLVLWIIFNDPLVAIIASIIIDLIVSAPTARHIWRRPHEESASMFVLSGLGVILALPAIHNPEPIGLVMPVYLILINCFMSSLSVMAPGRRPRRKVLA